MASDLIRRKALLDLYDGLELLEDADWDSVWNVPLEVVVQNIKDMPTVDAVEVRHGGWLERWDDFICSECACEFDGVANEIDEFHYCPNCGAKMDGNRGGNK